VIDQDGDVGQHPSIAVDSEGIVHISYYDASLRSLKYANGQEDIWSVDTVDDSESVGEYSSIALNSEDRPTIAYFDRENEDLKLARAIPRIP
jgi:hypothetical protein